MALFFFAFFTLCALDCPLHLHKRPKWLRFMQLSYIYPPNAPLHARPPSSQVSQVRHKLWGSTPWGRGSQPVLSVLPANITVIVLYLDDNSNQLAILYIQLIASAVKQDLNPSYLVVCSHIMFLCVSLRLKARYLFQIRREVATRRLTKASKRRPVKERAYEGTNLLQVYNVLNLFSSYMNRRQANYRVYVQISRTDCLFGPGPLNPRM